MKFFKKFKKFKKSKKSKKSIEKTREKKDKVETDIEKLLDDYVVAEKKDEIKEKLAEVSELYPETEGKIQKIVEAKADVERITDLAFKVCIFGNGGVGKTTLLYRYIDNKFESSLKMTIGVDIVIKKLIIEGRKVTLQVWDFGGEEQFRIFFHTFFQGANGGIFMYDLTRRSSLTSIDEWLNIFENHTLTDKEKQIPIIMVGGKSDLQNKRGVSVEEAIKVQESHNLNTYIECSAKTGENVEEVFKTLTRAIMKKAGFL